jgi:hypothetical protein
VGIDTGIRLAAAAQRGLGEVAGQLSQVSASSKGLEGASWGEITQRVSKHLTTSSTQTQPELRAQQLADLMRLQVDVSNYHLKVEMLSKVAESAVASLRKLQQPQ